eukprot:550856-Alexandrium_andersonii.AAC.1
MQRLASFGSWGVLRVPCAQRGSAAVTVSTSVCACLRACGWPKHPVPNTHFAMHVASVLSLSALLSNTLNVRRRLQTLTRSDTACPGTSYTP